MCPHHVIAGFKPVPHDRILMDQERDPYRLQAKPREPTACPDCHAVFHDGRWQWKQVPPHAHSVRCPACRRILEANPAGYIILEGDIASSRKQEVLRLIHNHAEHEKTEHPLQRIMKIENIEDETIITTTDVHLARGIGEAVVKAYGGKLELHYNQEDNLIRVYWAQ